MLFLLLLLLLLLFSMLLSLLLLLLLLLFLSLLLMLFLMLMLLLFLDYYSPRSLPNHSSLLQTSLAPPPPASPGIKNYAIKHFNIDKIFIIIIIISKL